MVGLQLSLSLLTRLRPLCLVLLGLQLTLLVGCKKPDEIRTYTVDRRERPKLAFHRMLGAIIPNDQAKEAWFFKLQGPDEEIGKLESDFLTFTKSVSTKNGKVTWKAPDTWKERRGGEFRVTTFLIPHGEAKPFELAVSKLDAPNGVNDQYLVMNLSRWRGQLQREPIEAADIPKLTTKVDFDGGSAWVVNMTGFPSSGGGMGMPAGDSPIAGHPPVEGVPPGGNPSDAAAPATASFEFTTPTGWTPGKPSSMRKASLAVAGDDSVADISVFEFPADANELLPNINRWRGEVGLKETTLEELQKTAKKIDVGGHAGDYVELTGEKDTILGVMVKKDASAWFFKLKGPTALAGREKAHFEEFVKSARWPQPDSNPSRTEAPSTDSLKFTTPAGWGPGKPSSMRKASLAVAGDDSVADISVFEFPAEANELLPNINRWRGEVGLKAVTAEELQQTATKIDVGGHAGDYVELTGEKDTILGVMVKKGTSAWFFKLKAPTALAEREKAHFEEFVKSARLP